MKQRPILFSGPMVLAILEGSKTQTRRIIKNLNQTPETNLVNVLDGLGYPASKGYLWAGFRLGQSQALTYFKCPYGQPGDRLWVLSLIHI